MNGLQLKAKIITAGLKMWEIARDADIHTTRLSGILNNRIEPTQDELRRIHEIIHRAERRQQGALHYE